MDRRQTADAIYHFEKAMERGASKGDIHLGLALCHLYDGRRAEAAIHAGQCVRIWPTAINAWAIRVLAASGNECSALEAEAARWFSGDEWQQILYRAEHFDRMFPAGTGLLERP